jgi:hypothetical protein
LPRCYWTTGTESLCEMVASAVPWVKREHKMCFVIKSG